MPEYDLCDNCDRCCRCCVEVETSERCGDWSPVRGGDTDGAKIARCRKACYSEDDALTDHDGSGTGTDTINDDISRTNLPMPLTSLQLRVLRSSARVERTREGTERRRGTVTWSRLLSKWHQ